MGNELASLSTAAGDTQTIDDIVETGLDELHQFFTGDTTTTGGFGIKFAELAFEDAVSIFCLLLFLKLDAVFRSFATTFVLTMHARSIGFLFVGLVKTVDGVVKFSCDFGFRTSVSCHNKYFLR